MPSGALARKACAHAQILALDDLKKKTSRFALNAGEGARAPSKESRLQPQIYSLLALTPPSIPR